MGDLARHFTYGRQTWPGILEPDSEIYFSGPRRQRELIRLSNAQIETQRECGRGIARSNLHAAQIVANEVQRQTDALEAALGSMTHLLSDDIQVAASQITDPIVDLGQQLAFEFSEIRWQLAQQQETMERILSVLTNSRTNEAQQLVKQGLRHYRNDQYREAEERFKKALEFDTTDYQVLMNLAYIEVHKGDASTAVDYFHRALVLPEQSDAISGFRAMWGMARVHYATGAFPLALRCALSAIGELEKHHETIDPTDLITAAGYAAQAGNGQDALDLIDKAVEMEPSLFARVATERDLLPMRDDVLAKLSKLAQTTYERLVEALVQAEHKVRSIKERVTSPECSQPVAAAALRLVSVRDQLKAPSYTGCLDALKTLAVIDRLLLQVDRLTEALQCQSLAHAETQAQKKLMAEAEDTVAKYNKSVDDRESSAKVISKSIAGIVVLYCIYSLVLAVRSANVSGERGGVAFGILTCWIWIPVCAYVAFFVSRFLLKIILGAWWKGPRVREAERDRYTLEAALSSAREREAEVAGGVERLREEVKILVSSV